jgi:Zn-dependent M16 (insulinase) family peptidase
MLSFFDWILHSRMPLVPTPARSKVLHACDQWDSSGDSTFLPVHAVNCVQTLKAPSNTFVELPVAVNFAARAVPTVAYTHEDSAALTVLSQVMSSKFLHREIREKGGAYGGGAGHSNGMFTYYSYRDPNTAATLDAFDNAADWAASGSMLVRCSF